LIFVAQTGVIDSFFNQNIPHEIEIMSNKYQRPLKTKSTPDTLAYFL
jgi:hypothetical protein